MTKNSLLLLLLIMGLSSACSVFKPLPRDTETVYTLAPPGINNTGSTFATHPKAKKAQTTLLISIPKAHPEYRAKSMIYSKNSYEIHAFSQNRWIDQPSKMLQPLLVQVMINNPQFHAVVASPFAGRSDYRLDTEIIDFRQEFSANQSQFRITLLSHLVDARSQRILASRQFTRQQAVDANTAQGGVAAANIAVAKMLKELESFVMENV